MKATFNPFFPNTAVLLSGAVLTLWASSLLAAPRILFIARGQGTNNTYELYTMNADGSDRRRITTNDVSEWAPALAPDNYRVACVRDDLTKSNLFLTSIDGSAPRQLGNTNAALCVQWADNHTLLFLAHAQADQFYEAWFRLWRIGSDGSGEALVFTNVFHNWIMGSKAFSVRRDTREVFLTATMTLQSYQSMIRYGSFTNLFPTSVLATSGSYLDHYAPAVSPDGTQVAFIVDPAESGGDHRLYVTSISGGAGSRLADVYCGDPSWSPDGAWLAFTRATNSTYGGAAYVGDIWRVSAQGTNLVALTTNTPLAGQCAYPSVFEPPAITLNAPQVSGNQMVLSWRGGASLRHTLQVATNGLGGAWMNLAGAIDLLSTGETLSVTDSVSPAGTSFYRVVARPE